MTQELFDFHAAERAALRQFGWHECVGVIEYAFHWRKPGGEIVTEAEAFAWLAQQTKE